MKKENAELKRANEILKAAASCDSGRSPNRPVPPARIEGARR
ncbi:hypothetical protein SMF913_25385 [Streptomyces malaysiensis]|uniref:Transposase n=1 Tax=Streptomyces malaysiensis TaxID=92644 RepID=A0A2J7YPG1_STRMQ|nr:hypothetical protein SMF913_25385 [Streptomyces malaysiensis]